MELHETRDEAGLAALSVPRRWREASPGEQISDLRWHRRMSQRHLAEVSGVDQGLISRLERGADVRWSTVQRLFEALGYYAVLAPLPASEEAEGLIEEEIQARKDREELGRLGRWGGGILP